MITIQIGKPRVTLKKGEDAVEVDAEPVFRLFTIQNFVTLGFGVALGIILKQQSDIQTLKRTLDIVQGGFYG